MGMAVHPTQDRDDGDDSLSIATGFYFFREDRSGFFPAMRAAQLVEAMLFDVELNRGNLDDLMAVRVGVNSGQSLATAVASLRIVVGQARTFFHWIQRAAMTPMTRLSPSLFPPGLLFLPLLAVWGV